MGEERALKPITVTLEQSQETQGTYRFECARPERARHEHLCEEERL